MKLEFSREIFEKLSSMKFHENRSSVSDVVPCGGTDRQTDVTKVTVTFRNFILLISWRLVLNCEILTRRLPGSSCGSSVSFAACSSFDVPQVQFEQYLSAYLKAYSRTVSIIIPSNFTSSNKLLSTRFMARFELIGAFVGNISRKLCYTFCSCLAALVSVFLC
jgi:hypothetical protein